MGESKALSVPQTSATQQGAAQRKTSRANGPILQDNRGRNTQESHNQESPSNQSQANVIQQKPNNTGLPDNLKSGMENLSGMSLDHVKVHYNSAKPATVQAHAYAQGNDIHLASGQEKHLPHELGHVVQQMQGRVAPTTKVAGMAVNDNPALENEADSMGAKAMQLSADTSKSASNPLPSGGSMTAIIQRQLLPVGRHREIVVDAAKRLDNPAEASDNLWKKAIYKELDGEGNPAANKVEEKLIEQHLIDANDWQVIEADYRLYKRENGRDFHLHERHNMPRVHGEAEADKWVASLIKNRIDDLYSTLPGFVGHAQQVQMGIDSLVGWYDEGKFSKQAFDKYKKSITEALATGKHASPLAIPERKYRFGAHGSVTI